MSADLIERLRREVPSGNWTTGSCCISSDGFISGTPSVPIMQLANPDGPEAAFEIERLRSAQSRAYGYLARALAVAERLEALLVKEREENLWNAYHAGHVERGDWTHMFMSDGEWLARECGFDPAQGHYADAAIRSAIPEAARKVLKGDA